MSVSVVNTSQVLLMGSEGMEITGPHCAFWTHHVLRRYGREVMDCSSWHLDLVRSDFHIFDPLRSFWLAGDMKQAVSSWLQKLDTNFFHARMQPLVSWWSKCQW